MITTDVNYKRTYSVPEFAEVCGISRAHAYRLVDRGEIPVVSLGQRRIIPGWYVDKLLGEPEKELPPSA